MIKRERAGSDLSAFSYFSVSFHFKGVSFHFAEETSFFADKINDRVYKTCQDLRCEIYGDSNRR